MDGKRYLKRKKKALAEGNREQLAFSCHHLGDYYNGQNEFDSALEEYKQEASIYISMGKDLEAAIAKRMVGEMCLAQFDFVGAKEHITFYLGITERLKNKVEQQRAYVTLGRVHLQYGQSMLDSNVSAAREQLKLAEKNFLRSLLLIKDLNGHISKLEQFDMQARCYYNIGVLKDHMEDYQEAINYYNKTIKIGKAHDLFELTYMCYNSMSLMYHFKMKDTSSALLHCNMALEVAKRLPDKVKRICDTLFSKADILIRVGDFASGKQVLTKAYKKNTPDELARTNICHNLRYVVKICMILDELVVVSSEDYAKQKKLYEILGDVCCKIQCYEMAIAYYMKMLECSKLNKESGRDLVPIYVSLSQTHRDLRQYEKALEYLWKELELYEDAPVEAFRTLCTIADISDESGRPYSIVHDIYRRALIVAAQAGNKELKLTKIVLQKLKILASKHKMCTIAEKVHDEATSKGITLSENDESEIDSECDSPISDANSQDLLADVCLDELTDSDASDLDETDKPRPQRTTRGIRALTIKRNCKGETQLHQACIAGNLELARRLIDQGHTVNVRDNAGWLPLHEACNYGHRDIVEMLLDKGAEAAINDKGGTRCEGITPLYDACTNGFLDVVELLLQRGADASLRTDFDGTCLGALDAWREKTELLDGASAQYAELRQKLEKALSKVDLFSETYSHPQKIANAQPRAIYNSISDEENVSEDDENVEDTISVSHKNTSRRSNPSKEYRNVMAQLKHPNRTSNNYDCDYDSSGSCTSSITSSSTKRRSALINDNEVNADNWLVNDLEPVRKRKRYDSRRLTSPPLRSTSKETLNRSSISPLPWAMDLMGLPETNAYDILYDGSTAQQRQKQARKLTLPHSASDNSLRSHQKLKRQSTLLDRGFSRVRSENSLCSGSEDSQDGPTECSKESDSTVVNIQMPLVPAQVQTTPILATTVSFKVKVQDELLLVPIDRNKLNEVNMQWLSEETARRYYKIKGQTPILRLKTIDGFAYEDSDPVNVAIEQSMIIGNILEWKISPLVQRYEEMCQQLGKAVTDKVKLALEQAQNTHSAKLEGFWLKPPETEPIFKALLHQTRLTVLDLSDNLIFEEGCIQLANALPTLLQLKTLRLRSNGINSKGLKTLLSSHDIQKLSLLEELDLSQNPLYNESVHVLNAFFNSSVGRALHTLRLSHCDITELYDFDLRNTELTSFDISWNQLSDSSITRLTEGLNIARLQSLNLSYLRWPIRKTNDNGLWLGHQIAALFEKSNCEKLVNLNVACCGLSDVSFFVISEKLRNAKDLRCLNISDNAMVHCQMLKFIVENIQQLNTLLATNCPNLLDETCLPSIEIVNRVPKYIELTNMEESITQQFVTIWLIKWGEEAKVHRGKDLVCLYVDENDLRWS